MEDLYDVLKSQKTQLYMATGN